MRTIRRRRREAKTDYNARLALLKSGKPRLVVRRTNKYLIAQIVKSDVAQDKIVLGATSSALLESGWPAKKTGSLKNRVAAYLTGYMIGHRAVSSGIKSAVLDLGLYRNIHKSRLYALVKGAIDAGLVVPCGKEVLPEEKELSLDKEMISIISKIKSKIGGKNA